MSASDAGRSGRARRRPWVFGLRLAATVTVLWLLLRFVDPAALVAALDGADLRYLGLIFLLRPLLYFVRGWRFWHLLQATSGPSVGERLGPWRPIGWHFVSLNLGTFTPAGLGEVSLVYFMKRIGVGATPTLTAMVLDKIITLLMVCVMGLVGAWLYLGLDGLWLVGAAALGLLGLVLARPLRVWLARLKESAGERLAKALGAGEEVLDFAWAHPVALAINVVAATVQSLIFTLQIWLGFRMLHTMVDLVGIFWLTGLGRLLNMLPITFGGLGVYEGSMVLLLEQLGASRAAALTAVLVPRTITWVVAGAVIAFFLWWRPKKERA